eukprot:8720829-Pyramimonas_sp.AAC.1
MRDLVNRLGSTCGGPISTDAELGRPDHVLTYAVQFRGIFFCRSDDPDGLGETVLCKGTIRVDPALKENTVRFGSSCVKARAEGITTDLAYGLDIVNDTTGVVRHPVLEPNLAGVLRTRIACLSSPTDRRKGLELLDALVSEAVAHTRKSNVYSAYGIERASPECTVGGVVKHKLKCRGQRREKAPPKVGASVLEWNSSRR